MPLSQPSRLERLQELMRIGHANESELATNKHCHAEPCEFNEPELSPQPTQCPACPMTEQKAVSTDDPDPILFIPIEAVTKFCYKFVKHDFQETIATAFFAGGKIWAREWKLYGLHTAVSENPIIFVPFHQLRTLVEEINHRFPTARVSITQTQIEHGLVCDFASYPEALQPAYLGTSQTRDEYRQYSSQMQSPPPNSQLQGELAEAYTDMITRAIAVTKRTKGKSDAHKQKQAMSHTHRIEKLAFARGLFGLSPEQDESSLSASHTPLNHPILVAVDVEAMETNHSAITEIGVATLDINQLQGIPPWELAKTWRDLIHARHIRIAEHRHHVNHQFIRGCPDAFEFGTSEFVPFKEIVTTLSELFRSLSKDDSGLPRPEHVQDGDILPSTERDIVLVGHDVTQDVSYLNSIGFNVLARRNTVHVLDTKDLYRAVSGENDSRSLGHILQHFDLRGWNLHNAGNDAVYTLWILISIVVSSLGMSKTAGAAATPAA